LFDRVRVQQHRPVVTPHFLSARTLAQPLTQVRSTFSISCTFPNFFFCFIAAQGTLLGGTNTFQVSGVHARFFDERISADHCPCLLLPQLLANNGLGMHQSNAASV
jgi:hypothetical protein